MRLGQAQDLGGHLVDTCGKGDDSHLSCVNFPSCCHPPCMRVVLHSRQRLPDGVSVPPTKERTLPRRGCLPPPALRKSPHHHTKGIYTPFGLAMGNSCSMEPPTGDKVDGDPMDAIKHAREGALASTVDQDDSNMLVHLSMQGVIKHVSANCQEILGYHPAEIEQQAYIKHVPETDADRVRPVLTAAMTGDTKRLRVTFHRRSQSGELLRVRFVGHVVHKGGVATGITGFESVLEEGEPDEEDMAIPVAGASSGSAGGPPTGMGARSTSTTEVDITGVMDRVMKYTLHELRNAIHALDASATEVKETAADLAASAPPGTTDTGLFESMPDMLLAARTTNVLVNDVLTLTRLREGSLNSLPEDVNVRRSVQDVLGSLKDLTSCEVGLAVGPGVPRAVTIDEHHVVKILRNVLFVAARLAPETKAHIYVTVTKLAPSHLRFEVVDRGSLNGMSAGELLDAAMADIPVKGTRAQRMSLLLPLVNVLVSDYLYGKYGLMESAGVVQFWFTAKFSPVTQAREVELGGTAEDDAAFIKGVPAEWLGSTSVRPALVDGEMPDVGVAPVTVPTRTGILGGTGDPVHGGSSAASAEGVAAGALAAPVPKGRKVLGIDGDGVALNLHVLLVDDAKVIRRQARNFLQQLGCTFTIEEDGDQVAKALAETYRPFDAIVLDILMHRTNGAEICQALRRDYQVKAPIIAMTSQTEPADVRRYYEMGFDVVLPKPFTRSSLGKVLVEGLQRRGGSSRYNRMSARVDVPGEHRPAPRALPALPVLAEGEDDEESAGNASTATPAAVHIG